MTPSPMKPEHEDKLCALRQPLLNVGQASRRPDNLNLLLKDSIFPQLIRARLEKPAAAQRAVSAPDPGHGQAWNVHASAAQQWPLC